MKYASLFILAGLLLTTARVAEVTVPKPATAFLAPSEVRSVPLADPILRGAALPADMLTEISLRF